MTRYRSILGLLCAAAVLGGCEKNAIQTLTATDPGAHVKFFNFGVNAPSVNFYANDAKMTAISSTTGQESTLGTAYGAAGAAGLYTGIAPGQYTLTGRISSATDNNLAISSLSATLADGKYYSFYQSGFYNATTKTVEAFIVEDPFIANRDYDVAYVRFVNAISNANPMTLYAKIAGTTAEVPVGGAVAYKAAGAFTALPGAVYDVSTRYTGSSATAISRTSVSFSAGRVYTVSARGDITVTSTTATNRPFLDVTANR